MAPEDSFHKSSTAPPSGQGFNKILQPKAFLFPYTLARPGWDRMV